MSITKYHFESCLEELHEFVKSGFYPIVLVNPSILYNLPEEEHGHYIIIKDICQEKLTFNDPDREYGGENKKLLMEKFLTAWKNKHNLIFIIKGEKK